ncbi:MAG: hypothetical protein OEO21_00320, partial [Candidatus Krumholzibacteria bacterium]|nr:hypothetical protein [Candidatus Krumholzibacteria bacterium]
MNAIALGKNLERDGEDFAVSGWQVTGCVDLVSERRYAMWRCKAASLGRHATATVAFRLAAARALAGDGCVEALACAQEGAVLAVLTERVSPVSPDDV